MKRKYWISLLILSSLLISALLAGCASNTATTSNPQNTTDSKAGKELKIGAIMPVTGPAAEKGKPGIDALLDSIEYVNKELGGADGYQIKLDWKDSAYNAANVTTIITDFTNSGVLMFTAMSSFEMTNAMGISNKAGLPGLAIFTSPNLYNPPVHIYGQVPDYADSWVAFANYYMKNIWKGTGKPKMALHLLNNPTGTSVKDAAVVKAAGMGIDLVEIQEHAATTISEKDSLTRIKSKNPDVLFISSTPQPTSIILKNARDLGMSPQTMTIGMAYASFTKSLIDLAGKDVTEGIYGVYPTVTWEDNIPGVAKAREYLMKNNPADAGNMDYLMVWCTGLISAEILKNAVQAVGYEKLAKGGAEAWKAVEESGFKKLNYDVAGIQGAVSYTPGDNRLAKYIKIYTVKNGIITPIGDWVSTR
ncbi:MAG TPA: ABC transporter substrate-binding protein [Dehalococcoidales bacterium]|nr:ABC transporter substrate-binding protein [Dehalococcoidales bacterium]